MTANPFLDCLPEVSADEVIAAPDDIWSEARGNLWSFSITAQQAATLGIEEVTSFVHAVAAARGRRLSARGSAPMLFYCWHDEQAVQLRFSLVSASHDRLPFGCAVAKTDGLDSIVSSFLSSPYHDGIPQSAMSEAGPDSKDNPEVVLPVWVLSLPGSDPLTSRQ